MMNKITYAYLEILQLCNLRCSHCYANKNKEFLRREDWIKILDKLKKFGIKKIVILGGEPTLHPEVYDILSYATSRFKDVTVETNGTTPSFFQDFKCNVSISFESCDPKKNDEIRKFENSDKSVYQLAVKKLISGKNYEQPKIARFTLYNDTDVLGSIIMAEKLGANAIFMPLINLGKATEISYKIPSAEKIREAMEICMNANEKLKGYHQVQVPQWYLANIDLFNKYSPLFEKQSRICQAGVQRLFIDFKGEVYPCMFLPKFKFGNILKDNILSINKKINEFNKKIRDTKPYGNCKGCSAWKFCHGGRVCSWIHKKELMGEECPMSL